MRRGATEGRGEAASAAAPRQAADATMYVCARETRYFPGPPFLPPRYASRRWKWLGHTGMFAGTDWVEMTTSRVSATTPVSGRGRLELLCDGWFYNLSQRLRAGNKFEHDVVVVVVVIRRADDEEIKRRSKQLRRAHIPES